MPTLCLPEDPSLENLKKQAKRLLRDLRAGDPESVAWAREHHPLGVARQEDVSLHDAQFLLARGYGFPSWAKLKAHLQVVERFLWDPPEGAPWEADSGPRGDAFLRFACLVYGEWKPSWPETARRWLAEEPDLGRADLYAAAACGDVEAARRLLASDFSAVHEEGGPLDWEPLLYACYSRLTVPGSAYSTLEVARLLLAAGADPNAGFLWRGNVPPFTALTGAFGEGEDGNNQPPHPDRDALARLLLESGADPNDGQTLYNRHFRPDDGHLELLFEYGLGKDQGGPWFRLLGDRLQSPAQMLVEELWAAARKGFRHRVELLVEHGAEVDTPGVRDGRRPYESAIRTGNLEIAEYLARHGAERIELDPDQRFAAACLAGRREEARALLAKDPDRLRRLGVRGRVGLAHHAVEADRPEAVRLLAELGCELNAARREEAPFDRSPLHDAAWSGNLPLVRLLVELGADPEVRDPRFQATPLGWAEHNHQSEVVAYLAALAAPGETPHE